MLLFPRSRCCNSRIIWKKMELALINFVHCNNEDNNEDTILKSLTASLWQFSFLETQFNLIELELEAKNSFFEL